ncbi:MAG TPA: hypothetical protein VJH63_04050 [Candidatus Paceibacterota bacterium]
MSESLNFNYGSQEPNYNNLPTLSVGDKPWNQGPLLHQHLEVDNEFADKLNKEAVEKFNELLKQNPEQALKEMVRYVIDLTPSDNYPEWVKHASEGISLSEAAKNKWCLCFHRAIAFQLLSEKLDKKIIQSAVIEGKWMEGDKYEMHLYNKVRVPPQNKIYLADASFLDTDASPLIKDITDQTGTVQNIRLANGDERIYTGNIAEYYKHFT